MEELGESSAMQLCGEEASTTSVFSQPINVEVDLGDIPLPDEVLNPEREKIRLTFGASKSESPNDALPQTSAPVLKKPALPLPSCTPSITILNRHPLPKVDYDWGIGHFRNYKTECIVGEGTYGKVYKALCLKTKTYVALKKIRRDDRDGFPITAIREIKILRQLDHKNIVKLQNVITDNYLKDGKNRDPGNFYLVFEYVDHDLCGLLEGGNVIFSDEQLAAIFKQLLLGLEYCHKLNFLHRDIKCPNILVNKKGQVKLADFGLSRLYSTEHERLYTNRVVTLWYRPPELLLGEEKYGPAIDIWSVGCILGELYLRTPIFRGNNENEQLELIYQTCGTPDTQNWSDFKEPWCTYFKKLSYSRKIRDRFSFIPPLPLDLLDKLLQLNPSKRPSVTFALAHDWLENVDPEKVPPPILSTNQDCHELWVKKQRQAHTKEIVPASSDHSVRVKRSN
uniref:Protein kinase domain-containing protein n=1 Tax=Acrobeloides nanus TaxID=290746 RepID=A0A914CIN5_9BILA